MPADAVPSPVVAPPATPPAEFDYDVFISYSHHDEFFVKQQLKPKLESANLRVYLDSEAFAAGSPSITNMERAVERSRHTIAVLTPQWVESEWCGYEALLVSAHDPMGRRRRLLPLLLKPCKPTPTIRLLSYRDFSVNDRWESEWPLLLRDLQLNADTKVDHQQHEAAGSVVAGIEVLIEAMRQQSGVRTEVAQFQSDFEEVDAQLRELQFYKQLHDLLHEMEKKCFRVLEEAAKHFPDDEDARCNCGDYESELSHLVSDLQQTVANRPPQVAEPSWIPRLVLAHSEIHAALDPPSKPTLDGGIRKLGGILSTHPSKIDTALNSLAQHLRLKNLLVAMVQIHDRLVSLEIAADRLETFHRGAENLLNLKQRLENLVARHNRWQEVDDELRRIDNLLTPAELGELVDCWDYVRSLLDPVAGDPTDAALADVREDGDKLTKAISDQENTKIRYHFRRVRSETSNHFYRVDKALKAFCAEIAAVGAPISLVLKTLSS